jgi:two-component system response regulator FlrC
MAHPWPGNVRELQNTLERAVLLATGNEITPAALMFDDSLPPEADDLPLTAAAPLATSPLPSGALPTLHEAEKGLIARALQQTEGNRTHAAKMLGISVRTLRNKLNEYKQDHGLAAQD